MFQLLYPGTSSRLCGTPFRADIPFLRPRDESGVVCRVVPPSSPWCYRGDRRWIAQAATNIVVWGTSTLYQLKESAQMRKSVARSRASRGLGPGAEKDGIKVDAILGKQIVEGALGGVLIMMNSPALGRMGDAIKRYLP